MKKSRRVLAIVLAICMTLTLQPMTALGLTNEVINADTIANASAPASDDADANNDQIDNAANTGNTDNGDENIDTQAGEPVATVGADSFDKFEEAWQAALNGGNGKTLTLLADAELAITDDVNISTETTIDLNGFTLDITGVGANGIIITNGGNLTIQNGSITANGVANVTNPVFQVEQSSSLKLDRVNFTTDGTGLYPRGDAAKVEVVDCEITANAYAVSTNAATSDNYNVVIELTDSTLIAENTAVLVNVPCTLNVDKCELFSNMQGVIVRGGTANIENSTITQAYDGNEEQSKAMADYFLNKDWGSGNMVNLAALTIGNKGTGAYQYPTDVTLVNTELKVEGEYADLFPAIYGWANIAEENGVTLKIEKCNIDENKIVLGNEGNNINVTKDANVAYIKGGEHYATLSEAIAAAQDGDEVILLRDVDVAKDQTDYGYEAIFSACTLNLNGHTITGNGPLTLAAVGNATIQNGKIINNNESSSAAAVVAQNASIFMDSVTVEAVSNGVFLGAYVKYSEDNIVRKWGSATLMDCNITGGTNGLISGGSNGIAIIGPESQNDINQFNPQSTTSSLNLNGNTVVKGAAYGVSGNGSCDNTFINIGDNAEVYGGAVGLYHPQQGTMYFGGNAKISGPVGLQICGGSLFINGGTLESTDTVDRPEPYKNMSETDGTAQDGAALSILSRAAYGNVIVDISNGGDNVPKFVTANKNNSVVGRYGFGKVDGEWSVITPEPTNVRVEITGGEYDNDINHAWVAQGYESVEYANEGVFRVERPTAENSVAMIERSGIINYYKTLQAAVDAALAGDEVALLKAAAEDIVVAEGKNLTLNLGEFTLTNVNGNTITNNGTLEIVGKGTVDNTTHQKAAIVNNGDMTLAGGTYTRSAENSILGNAAGANSYYVVCNDGKMTIENGVAIKGTSEKSSMVINGRKGEATLNIVGGELSQNDFCTIKNDDYGTLNISGGKISGVNPVQNWAKAVISGGEIEGIVYTAVWSDKFNSETIIKDGAVVKGTIKALGYGDKVGASKADVIIEGGDFDVKFDVATDNADVVVSGGTFTAEVLDEYLASGRHCIGSDKVYNVNAHQGLMTRVEAKEANCKETGYVAHWHCDCGKNFSDSTGLNEIADVVIPIQGHKETSVRHELAKEATCVATGNIEYWYCSDCEKYFDDINMKDEHQISAEKTVIAINPDKHASIGEVAEQAPTCTVPGLTKGTICLSCDTVITAQERIEATGHDMKPTAAHEATCTVPGNEAYWTCNTCNKIFSDAEGKTEITLAETVIPAKEHDFDNEGVVTTAATCTTPGVRTHTCNNCDATSTEPIEELGHNAEHHAAVAPSCTVPGNVEYWSCDRCGNNFSNAECTAVLTDVVAPAINHTLTVQHDANGHWTICHNAGCDYRTEAVPHEWVQGTPSGNQRVDTCGFEGCGATRTVTLGGGGGGGGGSTTVTPDPGPVEIDDPDVPLAKPFLFTDVVEKDWCYDAVKYVSDEDLMNGLTDTLFGPNDSTTRGMIATIIHRMESKPAVEKAYGFKDVATGSWYADAVNWAASVEVVKGYDEKTFAPEQNITREQLVAILFRYANMKNMDTTAKGDLTKFADQAQISEYAQEALTWAVGAGLMSGREGNLLAPQGQTTRAELAQVLMRFQNSQAENQTQK